MQGDDGRQLIERTPREGPAGYVVPAGPIMNETNTEHESEIPMHRLCDHVKRVTSIFPVSVTAAAATVVNVLDTKGFDAIEWTIRIGTLTTDKTADAYIAEGETTSPATKIAGTDITQIVGVSSNGAKTVTIRVDLTKGTRARYQKPVVTIGSAGTGLVDADAILYRAEETPDTNAERGDRKSVV